MTKLSDYVMDFLTKHGVDTVYTVSGGGIMHLLDSLGRNTGLKYHCNYHEQACAICAEGHARVTSRPAAVLVTVGPGAANAIAGLVGAWYDGLPMIVLTGQVRRDLIADYAKIRQSGPQEGNTVAMAAPVTKYAKVVMEPTDIRFELEKSLHMATSGRPGPVLLDIPLDVQAAQIDPGSLRGYTLAEETSWDRAGLKAAIASTVALLEKAKRPVLVGGTGVRMGCARDLYLRLAEMLSIPIVAPYTGKDLVPEDHPLNLGIFGTAGQRRANFTVQNADLLLGCAVGFSLSKVGFNFKGFAPLAKKVLVDIDDGQLRHQVIKPDLAVHADIKPFLEGLLEAVAGRSFAWSPKWLSACREWRRRYPIVLDDYFADRDHVNSYVFMDHLADFLNADDTLVAGNGLDTVTYYQAFKVKEGQRTMTSNNWGSMGWDLPLTIGACIASGRRRTVCVTGDGSIQWNIQELLSLRYHQLPVKVFVFNNRGYSSIRATQNAFFEGRYFGADASSGVANPDFEKLAAAYSLSYHKIATNADLDAVFREVFSTEGPALCEVNIAIGQGITPKASAYRRPDGVLESRPLEDMAPFLPRDEVHANMHQFDGEI